MAAAGAPGGDTRVCVKNLPRHCSDARLREHFAARGEVTDAKILRTRHGRTARTQACTPAARSR